MSEDVVSTYLVYSVLCMSIYTTYVTPRVYCNSTYIIHVTEIYFHLQIRFKYY